MAALAKAKNAAAAKVLKSWAEAEWFTSRKGVPETIKVKVFKVDGEINTDDFSPAGDAWSRPDIPLHALAMGKTRFKDGLDTIAKFRKEGLPGRLRGRRGRHRLLPQVGLQQRPLGTSATRSPACRTRRPPA